MAVGELIEAGKDSQRIIILVAVGHGLRNGAIFIAPIAGFIAVWHVATVMSGWPDYLLPSPFVVAQSLWGLISTGVLLDYLVASIGRLFLGCLVAFVVAVPLGYAIGAFRIMDRIFSPLVSVVQPIPGIAWIPLAILWFGLGPMAVGFIIFLAAFFPILLNTVTGVRWPGTIRVNSSAPSPATIICLAAIVQVN